MTVAEIMDWQRRFREAPAVWALYSPSDSGSSEVNSLYESKEAAEIALSWHRKRRGGRGYSIGKYNVHSLELARERWGAALTSSQEKP